MCTQQSPEPPTHLTAGVFRARHPRRIRQTHLRKPRSSTSVSWPVRLSPARKNKRSMKPGAVVEPPQGMWTIVGISNDQPANSEVRC